MERADRQGLLALRSSGDGNDSSYLGIVVSLASLSQISEFLIIHTRNLAVFEEGNLPSFSGETEMCFQMEIDYMYQIEKQIIKCICHLLKSRTHLEIMI